MFHIQFLIHTKFIISRYKVVFIRFLLYSLLSPARLACIGVFIQFLLCSLLSPTWLACTAPECVVTKMEERPK